MTDLFPSAMILFDTETTGLVKPLATPLKSQPHIIEFYGLKINPFTMELVDEIEFRCKPPVPSDPDAFAVHGITDKELEKEKPFPAHIPNLTNFFLGSEYLVAHNIGFDVDMLSFELQRTDRSHKFPWPPIHIDTVEETIKLENRRLSLGDLHIKLVGEEFEEAHTAKADVQALFRIFKKLVEQEIIDLFK